MENFRAPADRVGDVFGADGHDHEFLEVDGIVGMGAAIDDVHHRRRQNARLRAADIAIERQGGRVGGGLGDGERHAENGVGAEPRLVERAVEFDHRLVDRHLLLGLEAQQRAGDLAVDALDRAENALALVALGVAIALFHGFAGSRRGARGHGGAAKGAVFQRHIDLDRGIAARIEDFAGVDVNDLGHEGASFCCGAGVPRLLARLDGARKRGMWRGCGFGDLGGAGRQCGRAFF